jgi:hypothetical protein
MNTVLDIFNPQVSRIDNTITVTYCHNNYSGTCTYEECVLQGKMKKFKQRIHIMTQCQMDDVIEYLYKMEKINGTSDFHKIDHLIRDHSRSLVEEFIFS